MRFSIIIPLYNKASYVEKAIRSVLGQSMDDYELIIVNDGSKDDSLEVARRVVEGKKNVIICDQKNAGVSSARNNGAAASHGDYLCFLDADDWWEPTFLEEMDHLIAEYPDAGIYCTGYTILNETKHKTRVAPIALDEGFAKGYINYCKVYARNICMPICTDTACIPRTVFDKTTGFNPQLRLGEDFDFWIRIALNNKVVLINKPLAIYNQDIPASLRATGKLHAPETTEFFYYDEYESLFNNPDVKQLLDNKRVYSLMKYYLSKEYHDWAKQELAKVDWGRQSEKYRRLYRTPVAFLKMRQLILNIGATMKTQRTKLIH